MFISQREYAKQIGKSPAYVSKIIKQGIITRTAAGVDPEQADAERAAKHDPAKDLRYEPGAAKPPQGEIMPSPVAVTPEARDYFAARALRESYEAELARLKFESETKRFLPAIEVIDAEKQVYSNLRSNLRAVSRSAAPRCAGKTAAEIEIIIRRAIDAALKRCAEFPFGGGKISAE